MKLLTNDIYVNVLILNNGIEVLFSFCQAVAAYVPGTGYIKSNQPYSNTTNRHIECYIGSHPVITVTQRALDCLLIPNSIT